MAVRSAVLNVMANAALKAARGLIRDFGEVEQLQVSIKGPGDFVSTADLRAERTIKTELSRARTRRTRKATSGRYGVERLMPAAT